MQGRDLDLGGPHAEHVPQPSEHLLAWIRLSNQIYLNPLLVTQHAKDHERKPQQEDWGEKSIFSIGFAFLKSSGQKQLVLLGICGSVLLPWAAQMTSPDHIFILKKKKKKTRRGGLDHLFQLGLK